MDCKLDCTIFKLTPAAVFGRRIQKETNMTFLKALTLASMLAVAPLTVGSAQAANVVDTAKGAGTFGTLLAAATAAGLADALATTENITVFAPTDAAFAALPAGTVELLLQPENKARLVAVLTAHVLPRELASNQLPGRKIHVKTLNGDVRLSVAKSASGVAVCASNCARVAAADIAADNGVIHVIDTVLLP